MLHRGWGCLSRCFCVAEHPGMTPRHRPFFPSLSAAAAAAAHTCTSRLVASLRLVCSTGWWHSRSLKTTRLVEGPSHCRRLPNCKFQAELVVRKVQFQPVISVDRDVPANHQTELVSLFQPVVLVDRDVPANHQTKPVSLFQPVVLVDRDVLAKHQTELVLLSLKLCVPCVMNFENEHWPSMLHRSSSSLWQSECVQVRCGSTLRDLQGIRSCIIGHSWSFCKATCGFKSKLLSSRV